MEKAWWRIEKERRERRERRWLIATTVAAVICFLGMVIYFLEIITAA
jgi:hypothetical protein